MGLVEVVSVSKLRILFVNKKSQIRCASSSFSISWYSKLTEFNCDFGDIFSSSEVSVVKSPNKSNCKSTFFSCFFWFFKNLSERERNSNSLNNLRSSASLGAAIFKLSRFNSTGTSVRMVARNFDMRMSSTADSTFRFNAPLSSSVRSNSCSMLPNSLISLTAVFSPTPGQPGKLSALSPISASKSMTWSGEVMPYFWQTAAGSITS